MLANLYKALDSKKYTVIHPQWIANTWHLKKIELVKTYLQQGTCIDIGSGNKNIEKYFDDSKQKIVKIDYPTTSERYENNPNIYADVQQLPIKSNSTNTVIFFEVIEHVADDNVAISEIARILKKSGILLISAPFLYPLHDEPFDFKRYTSHGLINLLEKNGFEIIEVKPHGNSITTLLQLFNLSMLDSIKSMSQKSLLISLFFAPVVIIGCLLSNLVGYFSFGLKSPNALLLGHTIVAKK